MAKRNDTGKRPTLNANERRMFSETLSEVRSLRERFLQQGDYARRDILDMWIEAFEKRLNS